MQDSETLPQTDKLVNGTFNGLMRNDAGLWTPVEDLFVWDGSSFFLSSIEHPASSIA